MKPHIVAPMQGPSAGRRFATLACLVALLLSFACTITAQDRLPIRPDDFDYARKLLGAGFPDLAAEVLERISTQPGLTPKQKRDITSQLVDVYRALASQSSGADAQKYVDLMQKRMEDLKNLPSTGAVGDANLRYKEAQVLQEEGKVIARQVRSEQDAGKKKALIAEGIKRFDACADVLDQVAKDQLLKAEEVRKKITDDMEKQQEAMKPFRDMATKCEHQRAWTFYYKAQLWTKDEPEFGQTMSQAVQLFGAFAEAHQGEMLMLSARYGRGLAYRMMENKKDEAIADFKDIVNMIKGAGIVEEVMPMRARCAFNWAELAAEKGLVDEAMKTLDDEFQENTSIEKDPELKKLGLLARAKVLMAKARLLQGGANPADAKTVWTDAAKVLGEVIAMGGAGSYESRELLAKVRDEGKLTELDAQMLLDLATGKIADGDHKGAIEDLRKVVDKPGAGMKILDVFKAQRLLAIAYRLNGELDASDREFKSIFTRYAGKVPKEELAKAMQQYCVTLEGIAKKKKDPASDAAYVAAWENFAKDYSDTTDGKNASYFYANALQERARDAATWEKAAKAYANVAQTSDYYAKAQYLEGLCTYNVYKVYSALKDAKNPAAQAALKAALDKLQGLFDKLPPPRPGDDWHVDAARTLAEIYIDLNQPKDALGVVEMVTKKFPDAAGDQKMITTLVTIYTKLGMIDEAAVMVDKLSENKTAGGDTSGLLRAYLQLGDAFQKRAEQCAKNNDLEGAKKNNARAAQMYAKGLPLVPDDPRFFNAIAVRSFMVGGHDTCIKAIDGIEKVYADDNRPADEALWRLRVLKARCYRELNSWPPEGIELLKKLDEHYKGNADILKLRASVSEVNGQWQDALDIWEKMSAALKSGTDDWWDVQYHRVLCRYKLGKKAEAGEMLNTLRAVNPSMGPAGIKQKFDELQKQYEQVGGRYP